MRTIPNMADLLRPIDEIVNKKFLPAITEQSAISESTRKLLSLPVKLGGLGIPIFSEICEFEFNNSQRMSKYLVDKIVAQDPSYTVDLQREREIRVVLKKEKETREKEKLLELRRTMSKNEQRVNEIAQMKGASAWLTALPLKEEGFVLNKREFFDGLAFRYCWQMKRLPQNCACGSPFNMEHAMTCMKGGYVVRRHDRIRDLLAKVLADVAHGVHTEPHLQPLTGEVLSGGSNVKEGARLDIVARDFWQIHEMAFFDIMVFNPIARSHINTNLETLFKQKESLKKRLYNNRVTRVEHGSFTPVILSALGGFGVETSRFLSKLVEKVSEKKDLESSVVSNYIRTKISFELVRSQVACVRGSRSLRAMTIDVNEAEVVDTASVIRDSNA